MVLVEFSKNNSVTGGSKAALPNEPDTASATTNSAAAPTTFPESASTHDETTANNRSHATLPGRT